MGRFSHITLDIRQIKETASSIEDVVSGKAAPAKPAGKPSSSLVGWVGTAWAETPQLKFTTREVQKALDARRDRFDELKRLKAQGGIGEDKEGYVTLLGGGSDAISLVEAENRDRETIYRAIVEQNNLAPDSIGAIRATFAEVQRERADAGEKIQKPSGEWVTK